MIHLFLLFYYTSAFLGCNIYHTILARSAWHLRIKIIIVIMQPYLYRTMCLLCKINQFLLNNYFIYFYFLSLCSGGLRSSTSAPVLAFSSLVARQTFGRMSAR